MPIDETNPEPEGLNIKVSKRQSNEGGFFSEFSKNEPKEPISKNLSEYEKEMEKLGWTPPEKFKGFDKDGNPKEPKSAEEWGKALNIPQVANERLKTSMEENSKLQEQLQKMQQQMDSFIKSNNETRKYNIDQELVKAKDDNDFDRVETLLKQKISLESNLPQQPNQPQQTNQPNYNMQNSLKDDLPEFSANNTWYNSDPRMRAYMNELVSQAELNGFMAGRDSNVRLTSIGRQVENAFNMAGNTNPPVANSSSPSFGAKPREKGYADIPAADRKICDYEVSRGLHGYKSKEEWAKDYFKYNK